MVVDSPGAAKNARASAEEPDGRAGPARRSEPSGGPIGSIPPARLVLKLFATACALGIAAVAALVAWNSYVMSPWTRDGRIRVQVASVAPQVSGQITEVRIVDNQFVHEDDVLYVIDRFDYQNGLDAAEAQLQRSAADYQVKRVQAQRRQQLSDLSTSTEQRQLFSGQAVQAQADFKSAQVKLAMAEMNLARTEVRSPVTGFITNLQMRVGDYARAGTSNVSIIDADSFWLDGYFEETKLARVCVGDRAEAHLMGYRQPILGVVDSVTRGIAVSDAAASTQGLPSVDPIYTWVRLAQRVPVRIRITSVPSGVPLVSGMTATIAVHDVTPGTLRPWWRWSPRDVEDRIRSLYATPPARPDCVPREGSRLGTTVTIRTPAPGPARGVEEVNPDLKTMPLHQRR